MKSTQPKKKTVRSDQGVGQHVGHDKAIRVAVMAAVCGGLLAALACGSIPDNTRYTIVLAPDPGQFQAGVSRFFERRCGTLDCHGQVGRPLRIYGARGLRLSNDAGLRPTTGDTSIDEIASNYRSVVALQPEEMSRAVAASGQNFALEKLLIIMKPLGLDNGGFLHKGGSVISSGDDGYRCMATWIQGAADEKACTTAADAF